VGDTRELGRKEITATRPERYAVLAPPSYTAVTVEFDFVEPLFAVGNVLNGEGVHWLDEIDSGGVSSSCFHLGIV